MTPLNLSAAAVLKSGESPFILDCCNIQFPISCVRTNENIVTTHALLTGGGWGDGEGRGGGGGYSQGGGGYGGGGPMRNNYSSNTRSAPYGNPGGEDPSQCFEKI